MKSLVEKTSKKEQRIALKSFDEIGKTIQVLLKKKIQEVEIKIQATGKPVTIPLKAVDFLYTIISTMAQGKSITIIPSDSEVTTQQAADMLNVSRPHIIKLLDQGLIPHTKTGSHRRISVDDLIKYSNDLKAKREQSLKFLAEQAQELRLGYE